MHESVNKRVALTSRDSPHSAHITFMSGRARKTLLALPVSHLSGETEIEPVAHISRSIAF